MQAAKPTCSMNRSAAITLEMARAPSRHHVSSRQSSISDGIDGFGRMRSKPYRDTPGRRITSERLRRRPARWQQRTMEEVISSILRTAAVGVLPPSTTVLGLGGGGSLIICVEQAAVAALDRFSL